MTDSKTDTTPESDRNPDGEERNNEATPPDPAADFDPSTVPASIQKGLAWLREFHKPAVAIGEHQGENEIAIYLGPFDLTGFEADYEQAAVEVIWFIPRDFKNSDPHWMITDRPLTRTDTADGDLRANNPDPNDTATSLRDYIREEFNWDEATAWSVRWSNANLAPSDPKHLRRVTQITERALQDKG